MHNPKLLSALALGATGALTPFITAGAAQASTTPQTVYVAPRAAASAADRGCSTAAFGDIGSALTAVRTGGTVIVCRGTYDTTVTVSKQVTLEGQEGATVNASGHNNGVLVTASYASIRGLTVEDAIGEGVLIDTADHVTVAGNTVTRNDLGSDPTDEPNTYAECTNNAGVPGDCGEGVHLMGSSYDTVTGNSVTDNSGGILFSDETAPTAHNLVSGNRVVDNQFDCGITVVAHSPKGAPGGVPDPSAAGVYDNEVIGNTIEGNGVKGEGGGVILATALSGAAVYDNIIEGNRISGNGLSGVTVHSHVSGQDMNGNVVLGNFIGTNNLTGDTDIPSGSDPQTTGVLVATAQPLSITVVGNHITKNHFGIWTDGPTTVKDAKDNVFSDVTVHIENTN